MSTPKISILTPNYNHGRYLRQNFAGVFGQTFTDFEFLITDDGSKDESREIIAEIAERDRRVKPNLFPENRGVKAAMQDLIERATGTYIFWAASDDFVISKEFFARAVAALDATPEAAGFYGITGIYGAEKQQLLSSCGTAETAGYNTPVQCAEGFLKCRSVVTSPSCIWRRDRFLEVGGGDLTALFPSLGSQVDFYLNHHLAFKYGMYYDRTPFACQRVYEARTNYSAIIDLWKVAAGFAEVERRLRPICPDYPTREQDWLRWRAYWLLDSIKKSGTL
jgi:glycosyltransferase involved in cell wall biosynthesis